MRFPFASQLPRSMETSVIQVALRSRLEELVVEPIEAVGSGTGKDCGRVRGGVVEVSVILVWRDRLPSGTT